MIPVKQQNLHIDNAVIERRRMALLDVLEQEALPIEILYHLAQSKTAAFIISDKAAASIRRGLADERRRLNESSALAVVKLAAETLDASGRVYEIISFHFEAVGTADAVLAPERERLQAGEIEVHTHVYNRPEYLGQVDIGDLIAALAGTAWQSPASDAEPSRYLRIFGVLSVYATGLAQLQFYVHDLRGNLDSINQYGLKKLGMPISLLDVF